MIGYGDFIKFKAGDVVRRIKGDHIGMDIGDTDTVAPARYHGQDSVDLKKFGIGHAHYNLELVKDESPIREVVKRELVAGEYGKVIVCGGDITCGWMNKPAELRAAAKTLTEIADYLEAQ